MQRKGLQVRDMRIPKNIDTSAKKSHVNVTTQNFFNDQNLDGVPTMKGNIEPMKRGFWNREATNNFNK